MPTRWIDQGAHQTIPIVEVPNRYLAGITEVAQVSLQYKTNWRQMLTQKPEPLILKRKKRALSFLPNEVRDFASSALQEKTMSRISLANATHSSKSINLTKLEQFSATLAGVKVNILFFRPTR